MFPGAVEIDDGTDNDCDGVIPGSEIDDDGDGFAEYQGDCDDANPARSPAAVEVDNGVDDDCDGTVDEGFDADGDGFTPFGGDCDDTDATRFPGAVEVLNGVDDDCDGSVDEGLTAGSQLSDSGVPGKGLAHAPGLKKGFNPKSKAALRAGKK